MSTPKAKTEPYPRLFAARSVKPMPNMTKGLTQDFHGNDLEDKFIVENFRLPKKGVFVDVGAGPDGIQGSNSYYFERLGWKTIAIDADPRNAEALKKNRKHSVSAVISSSDTPTLFYLSDISPDVSGKNKPDGISQTIVVTPRTLESVLKEFKIKEIDILSIDTEGTEIDVWESFNAGLHKPKILIVEYITQGKVSSNYEWYFTNHYYRKITEIGANLIFERI